MPGSPPIRVAEPATRPPPSARSNSAMPVASRSRQRHLGVEPDQLDPPAAAAQIVPRREGRHHPVRILDQAVPLAAVGALARSSGCCTEPQSWQT